MIAWAVRTPASLAAYRLPAPAPEDRRHEPVTVTVVDLEKGKTTTEVYSYRQALVVWRTGSGHRVN
jgi:hypothetical protein